MIHLYGGSVVRFWWADHCARSTAVQPYEDGGAALPVESSCSSLVPTDPFSSATGRPARRDLLFERHVRAYDAMSMAGVGTFRLIGTIMVFAERPRTAVSETVGSRRPVTITPSRSAT